MIPHYLRQKLKVEGQLGEWSELCQLVKDSHHIARLTLGRMDLDALLLISNIDNVLGDIFPTIMKNHYEGRHELKKKLSVPELLSLWSIISVTPNPHNMALNLVAQIDQHVQNLSHLVNIKPKALKQ